MQWTKFILKFVLFLDMASPILGDFIDISEDYCACVINMDVGAYVTVPFIPVNIQITETAGSSEMSAYLNRHTHQASLL
jgi:hypothetical protein